MLYTNVHMETNNEGSEPTTPTTLLNTEMIEVLEALEAQIKKQNSLKYVLIRGMVYGLGTVVGATILVALFGGIIATTISSLTGEEISTQSFEQKI